MACATAATRRASSPRTRAAIALPFGTSTTEPVSRDEAPRERYKLMCATALTVQQDIELPSPVTVFGSAEVALTDRFAEDWMRGYVTVPVISSEEN
jgi:hypothetical protein